MNHSALTAHVRHAALAVLLATSLPAARAAAQVTASAQPSASAPRTLTLDEAFRLAEPNSDDVRIARNAVTRAKGQYLQARSTVLPQVTASANYSRQLQNQFTAISRRFAQPPDPSLPPDTTTQSFNPISILFQSPNTITLGLQASQPLYLDNRFGLAARVAKANESVAGYGFRTARAQLRYDIASAYFDAAIADRFLQIAESSLVQTERTLRQTTLQRQVGTVAEYDLLRSRVARDAQRPLVISAQQNRDVSALRLKQLLNLPLTEPLVLATPIQDADMNAALAGSRLDNETRPSAGTGLVANTAATTPQLSARDTAPTSRTAVQQAAAAVEVQKGAVENAALQRLPSLTLSTNYQRFAYPSNAQIIPRSFADFYPGWTVALGLSVPIWTSGRISGDVMVAKANLADAEARLSQGKRAASLDVQLALRSLEQAEANWLSSVGTEEQADKALRIAEVRYTNGISTQLELSDIRNLLIQSQANQLTAARDLQLARLRMALLRDLPLGSGGGTSASGAAGQGNGSGSQQQQQGGANTPQQGTSAGGTQTGATSSNGTTGRPE
ncbi:MAG TPA: TolC family protein [Gemmatimonadaceae bacterium]|nr:TolC family protein [Gemmatimonadaceae bacterium]